MTDYRTDECFVCGENHAGAPNREGHAFYSVADAFTDADRHDRQSTVRYSNGAGTIESAYVAEHRPD